MPGKTTTTKRRTSSGKTGGRGTTGVPRARAGVPAAQPAGSPPKRRPAPADELPTRTLRVQPPRADAWRRFADELGAALGALEEDEYLVVARKASNRFVQFLAQGAFGMRAEAASDFSLREEEQLTDRQIAELRTMGWQPPTCLPDELDAGGQAEGSANYFLDVARPVPCDVLAALAVASLSGVYGVGHPGELEYSAASVSGLSIRFPHLGIRRRPK